MNSPPSDSAGPLLQLSADQSLLGHQRMAVADLREAARLWRLCVTLAWLDIKLRYRGSLLGPLWLTLSTALMIASMGFIYATLFHMDLHEYLPFLALSLVLWNFIGQTVGDACTAFTGAEGALRSMRMPFSLHAGRIVLRNLIILGHNVIVIVAVDLLLWSWPGRDAVLALPGILLWLFDAVMLTLLFGTLCARFRDIPPIVGSVMQMAFFISAVIWKPDQLGMHQKWLLLNPFFTILEVVRAPLLGGEASLLVWTSALAASAVLGLAGWFLFARVRGRVAFWV